jgi:hypothetical protein
MEDYVADREAGLGRVCAFLGVAAPERLAPRHRNASEGKRVPRGGAGRPRLATSALYLRHLKPALPDPVRALGKRVLYRRAPTVEARLDAATRQAVAAALRDDPVAGSMLGPAARR